MSTVTAPLASTAARPLGKSGLRLARIAIQGALRISTFVRMQAEGTSVRRQLVNLDGRLLDDIGITQAERDAIVLR